jgi:hypothetical protein
MAQQGNFAAKWPLLLINSFPSTAEYGLVDGRGVMFL